MQLSFVTVLFAVCLVGLSRAGPRRRHGQLQSKNPKPVPCEFNNGTANPLKECRDGATCSSDPLQLTVGQQAVTVKFCVREGQEQPDISMWTSLLMRRACLVSASDDTVTKNETCNDDDETCSLGPVSFSHDGSSFTAKYCSDEDESVIDFEDFVEDLCKGDRKHGSKEHGGKSSKSDSESSESNESEESMEATTASQVVLP